MNDDSRRRPSVPVHPTQDDAGSDRPIAGRFAAIDPRLLAELRRQIADIDAGLSEPGMPWRQAIAWISSPPTAEELAEDEDASTRS